MTVYGTPSILLLAAKGAKLIGPHGSLQVGKNGVTDVTGSMEWPFSALMKFAILIEEAYTPNI